MNIIVKLIKCEGDEILEFDNLEVTTTISRNNSCYTLFNQENIVFLLLNLYNSFNEIAIITGDIISDNYINDYEKISITFYHKGLILYNLIIIFKI